STGRFQCEEVTGGVGSRESAVGSGGGKRGRRNGEGGGGSKDAEPSVTDDGLHTEHSVPGTQYSVLLDELTRIDPSEIIVPESARDYPALSTLNSQPSTLTERPPWSFAANSCRDMLLKHFGTQTLEGFDLDDESAAITAAGALLEYVQETQKSALGHITRLEPHRRGSSMLIDEATRRSLELTQTQRGGEREGSLLSVIDETVTSMGARLLADWLSNPLTDAAAINRRLDAVDELTCDSLLMRDIREQLEQAYDLQRLAGRVATLRASPRDLGSLARTLALLPKLKAKLAGRSSELLTTLEARLDLCPEVRSDIETALVDDPPINVADGGVIRSGYNSDLDDLKDLARGGKQWIAEYQATQIKRTGITSLKVGFNKVFGYYLGVTAANLDKVPEDYIRKQTLKNEERFVTPELKEYEEKVLRAEERAVALEQELFSALRERVCAETRRLQQTAETLAQVDVLTALATLAVAQRYCRPTITEEPILDIRDGRHPVLDRLQPTGEFVPNDVVLGVDGLLSMVDGTRDSSIDQPSTINYQPATIALITGPNMAGKSTYIRQAALITVMAQMGSFVPAAMATIGIADRVFARVGASDELGKGQSTFMVEMTETARILNTATERSLVILDEIGRGTSTYDGISLAWAITEHLHDEVRCRTLFATHYHELTELSQTLKQVANWNVAVHERDGQVIFLHKIVPGAADRSYGIHVARIAGVPYGVISRAGVILDTLESDHHDKQGRPTIPARETTRDGTRQLSLFGPEHHPLVDELKDLNLDNMTPLQAMQELARMKERLS
ncbi:MAG: DNA mismatch repair protein MutS, partial [Planctomycetaceae bacterium]|nr:DNA mismatch repair protein MutS [Planctomycetaceae bacterium]